MSYFTVLLCCCLLALSQAISLDKGKDDVATGMDELHNQTSPQAKSNVTSPELTSAEGCPTNFVSFSLLPNNCYGFMDNDRLPFTWFDAATVCTSSNSRMVDFQSSDEEAIVVSYYRANIYKAGERHFWIGANDWMKMGSWVWSGIDKAIDYSNWANIGNDRSRNCAFSAYNYNFRWYYYSCTGDNPIYNVVCKSEKLS